VEPHATPGREYQGAGTVGQQETQRALGKKSSETGLTLYVFYGKTFHVEFVTQSAMPEFCCMVGKLFF
jgi:hypothetical protein